MLVGKNYKVIVAHFAHTAQANDSSAEMQGRAKNVHKKLNSYRFLQYLHLLWDTAFEISQVSLVFQRNEVAVSDVKHELNRVDLARRTWPNMDAGTCSHSKKKLVME